MGYAELNGTYQRLRSELDAAYSGPVWNSRRIDQLAEQIAQVELALAAAEPGASPSHLIHHIDGDPHA